MPAPTDCKCKDDQPACGSTFAKSCKLDDSTLYNCPGGKGSDPVEGEKCSTGNCLVSGDKSWCEVPSECKCKSENPACGSGFPSSCKLDGSTLYNCPATGIDPIESEKREPNQCTVSPNGSSHCGNDNCKCKDGDAVYGSVFLEECNLVPSTLYVCSGPGATPSSRGDCTNGCNVVDGPDRCKDLTTPDNCKCTSDKTSCGSQYPESCGLVPTDLYSCSGVGADPVFKEKCTDTCALFLVVTINALDLHQTIACVLTAMTFVATCSVLSVSL
ncbi:MAG: hypothetical protein J3Q66DRAFT_355596 [Benniella sp.]|nr:MAG: hypothetical protein J3Q66DRAFT_355596 [Benniella sp.]